MAIDSTLAVRRVGLARLRISPSVIDLIPAEQWYPQAAPAKPVWPFGKWGSPSVLPRRASCLDGSEITVAAHAFARARIINGSIVETAEDHAARIGAAMAQALDGYSVDIPGGYARFQWTGSQLLLDGLEADAFHVVVNLRVRCTTNHP